LAKFILTFSKPHVSICVKSLCRENLDKVFQAWKEIRSYATKHNIVLLDYRKTRKPFELNKNNGFIESECVQIMALNDEWEKREFVFLNTHLNDDDMLDAEAMDERLNQLRMYEKNLKCEEKNEMEQFFNGFIF